MTVINEDQVSVATSRRINNGKQRFVLDGVEEYEIYAYMHTEITTLFKHFEHFEEQ